MNRQSCWDYLGYKNNRGYGAYRPWTGKTISVHRFAYELFNGEIPKGLHIDHLCRNTTCMNPDHLEVVTQKENTLRGYGITAINKRKTHCKYGHEFTAENTLIITKGRRCRACREAYDKRRIWK